VNIWNIEKQQLATLVTVYSVLCSLAL